MWGPDNISLEFLLLCNQRCQNWLGDFYTSYLNKLKYPRSGKGQLSSPCLNLTSQRQTQIIATNLASLSSLRCLGTTPRMPGPIQLTPTTRSAGKQYSSLDCQTYKQHRRSVEKCQKAGIVLVDLTAACTIWHQGLTLNLLRCIPTVCWYGSSTPFS